jgi:hypothetical protein
VRKLGEPLVRAALATTLPRGGCRWDLAYMHAIRLDQLKPQLSRAGRTLLGQPCPNCTKRMQPAKQSQPNSSGGATQGAGRSVGRTSSTRPSPRTRVASPDPRKQLTASATPAAQHANCVICGGEPSRTTTRKAMSSVQRRSSCPGGAHAAAVAVQQHAQQGHGRRRYSRARRRGAPGRRGRGRPGRPVEDGPGEVIVGAPVAQVGWEQEGLVAVAARKL